MKRLIALPVTALLLMGCATPEPTAEPTPTAHAVPDCANLQPGEAWAGVGLHCGLDTITPTPTAPATDAETVTLPEDSEDPDYDCLTDGNRLCGANPIERVEAWGKFQTSDIAPEVLREAFRVTYMGTAMPGIDFPPSEYLTVPSSITLNTVHVFLIETGAI